MAGEEFAERVLGLLEKHLIKQTENSTLMVQKLDSIDKRFDDVIKKYDNFSKMMTKFQTDMKWIRGILIAFGIGALFFLGKIAFYP